MSNASNLVAPLPLLNAGLQARIAGDWKSMVTAGGALERIGCYKDAWSLLADAAITRHPPCLPEWAGDRCKDETLLVERRMRHTGAELRMSRFLDPVTNYFASVVVSTEARMVSLLARSFPKVKVVDAATQNASSGCTKGASYERLAQFVGNESQSIQESFRPLVPPVELVARLKHMRPLNALPVIGIAWHSTNVRKQLPRLDEWTKLLLQLDAHFVSLQYSENDVGLARLVALSGKPIEGANGIDQLSDLDGFAAQVASVDIVVTVSNTTAHMAGSLGIPCIVLLDGLDHLVWPTNSTYTPFYPHTKLLRLCANDSQFWVDSVVDIIQYMRR